MTQSGVDKMEDEDMTAAALKQGLQSLASELGFGSCRIPRCLPPAHASQFRDWLRTGAAGEMSYLERGEEKRNDPQKVLPGARSIIVLALNYFQGVEEWRKFPTCDLKVRDLKSRATLQSAATWPIAR